MDPLTIGMIVTLATLVIERGFTYLRRAHQTKLKSKCCGVEVEYEGETKVSKIKH